MPEENDDSPESNQNRSLPSVLPFGNVIMGAIIGLLIGLPIALSKEAFVIVLVTLPLGTLIGYRHRKSRLFLYFSVICVLILSWLVSFQMVAPEV